MLVVCLIGIHKPPCLEDIACVLFVALLPSAYLQVSQLWKDVVTKLGEEYPDVELSHMYIDNAAMQLIRNPKYFDVIVTGVRRGQGGQEGRERRGKGGSRGGRG